VNTFDKIIYTNNKEMNKLFLVALIALVLLAVVSAENLKHEIKK